MKGRRSGAVVKRAVDLLGAGLGLVLLSPLMIVNWGLVRVFIGSPVLFSQTRPGLLGRPFVLYKFRTMTDATGPDGELLPDEQRLTPFGRWLRSTSLDELPELFNVLKGELSLVGPRPLLMDYIPLYTPEQARRQEVKPGLTGWAQVNGRNDLSWEEKFKLDVWYVDNRSALLDLMILARTVKIVLTQRGITQKGQATMERFHGTNEVEQR